MLLENKSLGRVPVLDELANWLTDSKYGVEMVRHFSSRPAVFNPFHTHFIIEDGISYSFLDYPELVRR